ncbi:hypothetical protein [Enterococcus sp. BWR-S5]|uniref:hypothetical protein n=1 Tax=Enterococcus sp. BWR-S5 TaxID=2787714 RepID=UPI001921038B|nr:hypothetical protein [Enterococcus sp. BWR-S5]MBL1223736.1 hypothetical protein [Enterococcus sp. BWR-S5]
MIKKTVTYTDLEGDDEIKKEEQLRFIFTLPALRLYEQRTGRAFFDDYHKAFTRFIDLIKVSGADVDDVKNMTEEQQLSLLPIVSNPEVLKFVLEAAPCMYTEVVDGRFVQNDETASNAEMSLWLMNLVNAEFFGELLQEISANQGKAPKGNKKGKKK